MSPMDSENGGWDPKNEGEKDKIRQQMNRMLETSHFRNSRRYTQLFRFIVEETLEGRGDLLKERLIGVRLFERPADYDTSEDPIVRVTIAEIRIELLPGRYIPEFRPHKGDSFHPRQAPDAVLPPVESDAFESNFAPLEPQPPSEDGSASDRSYRPGRRMTYVIGSMAIVLIALLARLAWNWAHPSALDEFWRPLLGHEQAVLFCLPVDANRGTSTAAEAGILVQDESTASSRAGAEIPTPPENSSSSFLAHEILGENRVFSDALATIRISNYLAMHNLEVNIRPDTITTLDDMRRGPIILIGGFDNPWTLRALTSLRFRLSGTFQEQCWITDTKNPTMRDWGVT